jgi:hypothetical protein
VKHAILLAGIAAAALSVSSVAYAQASPSVTNLRSSTTTNPKGDPNNAQCAQPKPGETHVNMANCPKPATVPTPTKTFPKPKKDKKPATPANATQPITPPATNPAQACQKPNTPSATTPTPSPPQCDTNSGAHEGGPFGH